MEHEVWRFWMTKLDAGLITSLPASDPGSAAVWGSKRINPRPQFCLCLAWSGCPSNDDKRRRRRRRYLVWSFKWVLRYSPMRLRSRRPFVPTVWNLLDNLARLGIRDSEWTNHKWKTEYHEGASRLRAFVPGTGARPVGMGLLRAAWVELNRLRTGVGRFHSSMHKWGLAPSPNCECGASEQTSDHVLIACPIHRAPHGAWGLMVLDDKTRCWLNNITASIWFGQCGSLGSKRINPRPQFCLCLTWSGCPSNDDDECYYYYITINIINWKVTDFIGFFYLFKLKDHFLAWSI